MQLATQIHPDSTYQTQHNQIPDRTTAFWLLVHIVRNDTTLCPTDTPVAQLHAAVHHNCISQPMCIMVHHNSKVNRILRQCSYLRHGNSKQGHMVHAKWYMRGSMQTGTAQLAVPLLKLAHLQPLQQCLKEPQAETQKPCPSLLLQQEPNMKMYMRKPGQRY